MNVVVGWPRGKGQRQPSLIIDLSRSLVFINRRISWHPEKPARRLF
jgi:hypothetical protein